MKKTVLAAITAASVAAGASVATVAFADNDYAEYKAQQAAAVSYEAAKRTAVAAVGGGYVTDIDFELKRGRAYYEVEVAYEHHDYEVKVDANTGAVISKKLDD